MSFLMVGALVCIACAQICPVPADGTAVTAKFCGLYQVEVPYGESDVRIRVAVTDGLSGLRIGVSRFTPDKSACSFLFDDNDRRIYPQFTLKEGTACYDRTVRLGFCQLSGKQYITLLVQMFDLDYSANFTYSVTFGNRLLCGPPTTAAPTPRVTFPPPLPTTSTAAPTPAPRKFGVSTIVATSAAVRPALWLLDVVHRVFAPQF